MNVTIFCETASIHLNQIYTGFGELYHLGEVSIKLLPGKNIQPSLYSTPILKTVINNHIRVWFDASDEATIPKGVNLDNVDFYFKRSYRKSIINTLSIEHQTKVYPLGFNYAVSSCHDFMSERAKFTKSNQLKTLSTWKKIASYTPSRMTFLLPNCSLLQKQLEAKAIANTNRPKDLYFIFQTRLWDPDKVTTDDQKNERLMMNAMRLAIIDDMRREFGRFFIGFIEPTPFAKRHFLKYSIDHTPFRGRRGAYIQKLKNSHIGIATNGLCGTPGWKIGEYVALSKSIVSEPVTIQVPGNFKNGTNYFTFCSAKECVKQCVCLHDNPDMVLEHSCNNCNYYHDSLAPVAMIRHCLRIATARTSL